MQGKDRRKVVMVGAFPPPVHGMAAVNAAVREALHELGVTPLIINLAAPSLNRTLAVRLWRLPRVMRGLLQLALESGLRNASLYISVSGGLGQIYELAFILISRLRGMRVFLHHHSFAYLDKPSHLTRVLVWVAGVRATHVVLSGGMAERLQYAYRVGRVIAVSNAVFFVSAEAPAIVRNRLERIGFIGNISAEKGAFEFLNLMAKAGDMHLPLRARFAGPFQDASTEQVVRESLSAMSQVEYVGPQYGADKKAFYASLDALIFPSHYVNEAEPVTIHEALSYGIPVIAYGRGCIPEVVDNDCGLVVDPSESFAPAALGRLESWLADPTAFSLASRASAKRFTRIYNENLKRWQALLAALAGQVTETAPAHTVGRTTK